MSADEGTYKLPYKDGEYRRLNLQHMMWTTLFGGLFPAELNPIVEHRMASSEPTVMDAGYGTGIWHEIATLFPQASVLGVDIVLPSIPDPIPSNLKLQQLDLSKGMPDEYTGQFDIVHCRTVAAHMKDPPKLVRDLVKCLKPGGVIIIPEPVVEVLDEYRKPVTPFIYDPEIDTGKNVINARSLSGLGGYFVFINKLMISPKYQLPNVMLKSTGAVENILLQEFLIPLRWAGNGVPRGEEVGALQRTLLKKLPETTSELLIAHDVPQAVVDALKERAIAELEEKRCVVSHCASATAFEQQPDKS